MKLFAAAIAIIASLTLNPLACDASPAAAPGAPPARPPVLRPAPAAAGPGTTTIILGGMVIKVLQLTPVQCKQFLDIRKTFQTQRRRLDRDPKLTLDQKSAARTSLRRQERQVLEAVLTSDQRARLDQIRAQFAQRPLAGTVD